MNIPFRLNIPIFLAGAALGGATGLAAASSPPVLLNEPVEISGDFRALEDFYYLADTLAAFDPVTHRGAISYQRAQYSVRHAFDNHLALVQPVAANEFPQGQYAANPALPFAMEFVSPRALRLQMPSGPQVHKSAEELMLPGDSCLRELTLTRENGRFLLASDPLAGRVAWSITTTAGSL